MNAQTTEGGYEEVNWAQLSPVLDDAMAQLGTAEREAVLLRFFSGRSFSEVGQAFELSEDAARKRVERAVDKLRRILARQGVGSSAAALSAMISSRAVAAPPTSVVSSVTANAWRDLTAASTSKVGILMSMNKITGSLIGAVVLVTVGVGVRDVAHFRSVRALAAATELELTSVAERERALREQLAGIQSQINQARSGRSDSAGASTSAAIDRRQPFLTDPTYRQLSISSDLARDHLEFQRLYRGLGLTPDQISKFETIMALQHGANLDARVIMDNGGDPQTVYQKSGPEWSAAMRDLLGPDGFTQLENYLRSMPVRRFVDSLANPAASIGTPLSPEQADQLAATALANDSMYQSGRGTDPGTVNWTAVWRPASTILSSGQLTTFQTMVKVWTLQRQIQLGVRASHSSSP